LTDATARLARAAAMSADLESFETIDATRHDVDDDSIGYDVLYCGICHTDLHFVHNDLGGTKYPLVPGHEVAGVVTEVGKNVTKFKVGDKVGVGCIVDSCLKCKECAADEEQYCENGMTMTYGYETTHGRAGPNGQQTMGGYSTRMVVNERFAIKIPDTAPLDKAAPLLCAGITLYDPIKQFGVKAGTRVGVAGVGGLGMMGIKIAAALGAEVTAISRSKAKEAKAKSFGAKHFVSMNDEASVAAAAGSLDLILDTVSACHDSEPYANMLDKRGTLCMLGLQVTPVAVNATQFVFTRKSVTGSLIGGIKNTQEMIDFCCSRDIYPEIEVIDVTKAPDALQALADGNCSGVRYVIDCKTIQ
jgi:uncharacterized zinc-type alcohol dehydrogenase-like protein